jgi:mRNA interferase RelE/StbE
MTFNPLRVPKRLKKKLRAKPEPTRRAIAGCLRQLEDDPFHPGLRTKKMGGRGGNIFESRASRGDRVTWFWDGPRIVVEDHCKHDIVEGRG